jgi:DNA gyrase/topoisomerase IV subunit A
MSTRTPDESTSAPVRRASRSRRSVLAALLLTSAVGGVVAAVSLDSTIALTAAGAYAVAAGITAAVLLGSVVANVRRLWAYDRANLAGSYRTIAVERSAEQIAFAEMMASRVAEGTARIARLEAEIKRAERRREELGQALADEQERSAELEASLQQVQEDLAHLRDALTASETAEKRARAEVVAWEAESQQLA